jgi:hypothetical protein
MEVGLRRGIAHPSAAEAGLSDHVVLTASPSREAMPMLPLSQKILVRLLRIVVAALDRAVEKRVRETPEIRLTYADAIRACLHRSLQKELRAAPHSETPTCRV